MVARLGNRNGSEQKKGDFPLRTDLIVTSGPRLERFLRPMIACETVLDGT
jgi:hypothetical protein